MSIVNAKIPHFAQQSRLASSHARGGLPSAASKKRCVCTERNTQREIGPYQSNERMIAFAHKTINRVSYCTRHIAGIALVGGTRRTHHAPYTTHSCQRRPRPGQPSLPGLAPHTPRCPLPSQNKPASRTWLANRRPVLWRLSVPTKPHRNFHQCSHASCVSIPPS